ncbi:hypothetical protein RJT34_16761 [Clitoria ternatea]|uniref:Uncharacterized protein n=1 Tax=Clitoria ternatea TaxID=43366 RepID=A0AAN9PDY5_CLITE
METVSPENYGYAGCSLSRLVTSPPSSLLGFGSCDSHAQTVGSCCQDMFIGGGESSSAIVEAYKLKNIHTLTFTPFSLLPNSLPLTLAACKWKMRTNFNSTTSKDS